MSSIGEGIDFSQEQQKISGIVPSSHFSPVERRPLAPFWLRFFFSDPEDDIRWTREVSLCPPHAAAGQILMDLYGPPSYYFRLMTLFTYWRGNCILGLLVRKVLLFVGWFVLKLMVVTYP